MLIFAFQFSISTCLGDGGCGLHNLPCKLCCGAKIPTPKTKKVNDVQSHYIKTKKSSFVDFILLKQNKSPTTKLLILRL
jgi:hypothetical protein